jgi:hypothetical protein
MSTVIPPRTVERLARRRARRIKRETVLLTALSLVLPLIVAGTPYLLEKPATTPAGELVAAPDLAGGEPPAEQPTATSSPVDYAPAPLLSQKELRELPLADYDSVVPELLAPEKSAIEPEPMFLTATVLAPDGITSEEWLTALYAEPSPDASPIAAISSRSVTDLTGLAVVGRAGAAWLLVTTPARDALPSESGGRSAPQTYAWVRAADFAVERVAHMVVVDTAASTIHIETADGEVSRKESVTLGSPSAPTPSDTITYIAASYIDPEQTFTENTPIALLGSHTPTIDTFAGNAALNALHFSNSTNPFSKGCVRLSRSMSMYLATLPIGTTVVFL